MMRRLPTFLASALLLLAASAPAAAQAPAPVPTVTPPRIGDCTIHVTIADPPPKGWLKIDLNKETVAQKRIDDQSKMVAVAIKGPIVDGDLVRARIVVDGMPAGKWTKSAEAQPGTNVNECEGETPAPDERQSFDTTGYAGVAYDNFAAPALTGDKAFFNPQDAGTSRTRFIMGTDTEGRVLGKPGQNLQLWLYGETLYGVRSQDVDCNTEPAKSTVCKDVQSPANFHYILAHASTLEFYFGPRLELFTFQRSTSMPGKLYLDARFGYLALAESAGTTTANHHVGIGILGPAGPFIGSAIEIGVGKTDALAQTKPTSFTDGWNRFKLDGYLTFEAPSVLKMIAHRMFIEFYVDRSMGGKDPDAIQTFIGAEYDIRKLLGK